MGHRGNGLSWAWDIAGNRWDGTEVLMLSGFCSRVI